MTHNVGFYLPHEWVGHYKGGHEALGCTKPDVYRKEGGKVVVTGDNMPHCLLAARKKRAGTGRGKTRTSAMAMDTLNFLHTQTLITTSQEGKMTYGADTYGADDTYGRDDTYGADVTDDT